MTQGTIEGEKETILWADIDATRKSCQFLFIYLTANRGAKENQSTTSRQVGTSRAFAIRRGRGELIFCGPNNICYCLPSYWKC